MNFNGKLILTFSELAVFIAIHKIQALIYPTVRLYMYCFCFLLNMMKLLQFKYLATPKCVQGVTLKTSTAVPKSILSV